MTNTTLAVANAIRAALLDAKALATTTDQTVGQGSVAAVALYFADDMFKSQSERSEFFQACGMPYAR